MIARQGEYGAIQKLSEASGHSARQLRSYRDRGLPTLEKVLSVSEDEEALLVLRQADLTRWVVASRMEGGSSVRGIQRSLEYGLGVRMSYGSIEAVLHKAAKRGRELTDFEDLSNVKAIAMDEMFSQGNPVFAAIDLDSGYLVHLSVETDRKGTTWAQALEARKEEQHLEPEQVVKDAGSGLRAGVNALWPKAEQVDDLFHALYESSNAMQVIENQAYRAIWRHETSIKEEALNNKRGVGTPAEWAKNRKVAERRMEKAIALYDAYRKLHQKLHQVTELTDRKSWKLATSEGMKAQILDVASKMEELPHRLAKKVANYLKNRAGGMSSYLDRLHLRLSTLHKDCGGSEGVEAAVHLIQTGWRMKRGKRRPYAENLAIPDYILAMMHFKDRLQATEGPEVSPSRYKAIYDAVSEVLRYRHRASSAIENLNSVLRPYLVVQKHAQQGFMDLFQYYRNHRIQTSGPHAGKSAYEVLTGKPDGDWLTNLGFPKGKDRTEPVKLIQLAA